jgi:hypothetical protein
VSVVARRSSLAVARRFADGEAHQHGDVVI